MSPPLLDGLCPTLPCYFLIWCSAERGSTPTHTKTIQAVTGLTPAQTVPPPAFLHRPPLSVIVVTVVVLWCSSSAAQGAQQTATASTSVVLFLDPEQFLLLLFPLVLLELLLRGGVVQRLLQLLRAGLSESRSAELGTSSSAMSPRQAQNAGTVMASWVSPS